MKKGIIIHPDEINENWTRLLTGSDVSYLGIHPIGGNSSCGEIEKLFSDRYEERAVYSLREKGIDVAYEMHAMSWLLPRDLFGSHPGYFRMGGDGVRTPDCNMCFSSPEALEIVARRAALLAKRFPSSDGRYHFWTDDTVSGGCTCEKCSALTPSEQALTADNAVLCGIRSVDPAARLCYLAYSDMMKAPVSVAPADGIYLEYAPMARDFTRPLGDVTNEKNAREAGYLADLFKVFGYRGSQALDYWFDNSMYSGWKKPPRAFTPDIPVMLADLAFYQSAGFEHATTFACYLGDDYIALHGFPDLGAFFRVR